MVILGIIFLVVVLLVGACGGEQATTTSAPGQSTTTSQAVATTSAPTTATTASTEPSGETIELSMASLFAPESDPSLSLQRWADKIAADSNGRLTIRHYAGSTLLPAPEMRTGVEAGTADLGCSFIYKPEPGFEPSMVMSQLILGLDFDKCVQIFNDIWNQFPDMWAGQWNKFKLIWIAPIDPNLLFTVQKPVRTMEDIKGLQIRMPSATAADMFKALGAAPVSMSTADWVISLDKKTTDGAATSVGSVLDNQVGEKLKYCTRYSTGPGVSFLIMNKQKYDSLPDDLKKVIDDNMEWGKQDMIETKRASEKAGYQYLQDKGVQLIDLSADEYARWDAAVAPVFDKIAADLDKAGYPGTELVKFALERARFYYSQQ
jgi:TRAP-type C4-dicarboxylate transport system substrate-binding protein